MSTHDLATAMIVVAVVLSAIRTVWRYNQGALKRTTTGMQVLGTLAVVLACAGIVLRVS